MDLKVVGGTGPAGRITASDVERAAGRAPTMATTSAAPAAAPTAATPTGACVPNCARVFYQFSCVMGLKLTKLTFSLLNSPIGCSPL